MTPARKFIGRWSVLKRSLWTAAGFLLPATGLFAASSADMSLTIRPIMQVTPASVNDLAVASTAQEGQLQLNWTAPKELR